MFVDSMMKSKCCFLPNGTGDLELGTTRVLYDLLLLSHNNTKDTIISLLAILEGWRVVCNFSHLCDHMLTETYKKVGFVSLWLVGIQSIMARQGMAMGTWGRWSHHDDWQEADRQGAEVRLSWNSKRPISSWPVSASQISHLKVSTASQDGEPSIQPRESVG